VYFCSSAPWNAERFWSKYTISSAQGAPSAHEEKQYHNMLENIAGNTTTLIGLFGTVVGEGTMGGIVMELQISSWPINQQ